MHTCRLSWSAARFGAALLVVLASAGCGESASPELPPPDRPEQRGNGALQVREGAMTASLSGRDLKLKIPYEASSRGEGALQLQLVDVAGDDPHDSVRVDYEVERGDKGALEATLRLPERVTGLGDAVAYSVRVREDAGRDGIWLTRSVMALLPRHEVQLQGPARVEVGKRAVYRVRAQDPETREGVANAPLRLRVEPEDDEGGEVVLEGRSDARGDAVFEVDVERSGSVRLAAMSEVDGTPSETHATFQAELPGTRVLLTTDKPLYQPGQTMHLRALALERAGNAPRAGVPFVFEVADAKGNKVLKREIETDDFGIAHTTFRIGTVVNMGTFEVSARSGDMEAQKTVEVSRYVLPKFAADVDLDHAYYAPGGRVQGTLHARYFFGRDVAAGSVLVEASTLDVERNVFARVMGKTDAAGRFAFEVALPGSLAGLPIADGNALVDLAVTVTDTAGQVVEKFLPVLVAAEPAQVAVVPEATRLVPGVENRLLVFVSDPAGAPIADARVRLTVSGQVLEDDTDTFGRAELTAVPETKQVKARVTLPGGETLERSFDFDFQDGRDHLLVRTDRSAYAVGDSVTVDVHTSPGVDRVFVDWLNAGQAVDARALDVEDGRARFTVDLDTSLAGDNRISAYVVDADGQLARAGRSVFVRQEGSLSVSLETDKPSYAPGETAELSFQVHDDAGERVEAALGVQIVDEAVFALVEAQPGLLRTYFELDDMFAEPDYQIGAPPGVPASLIYGDTLSERSDVQRAGQRRLEGQLAALGDSELMGLHSGAWQAVIARMGELLVEPYAAERKRVTAQVEPVVESAIRRLANQGCALEDYWCESLDVDYHEALREELTALENVVLRDPWGRRYRHQQPDWDQLMVLATRGPDETWDTSDDGVLEVAFTDLGVEVWGGAASADAGEGWVPPALNGGGVVTDGVAGGGDTGGNTGGTGEVFGSTGGTTDEPGQPRVRRDFPETLYVNPALITDGDGLARVQVPMADSITEWRVSTLANSQSGKLGGGLAGVTVFQEFFVDIDFPAELTRGDEVTFPLAVYNYLEEAQDVELSLTEESWYTPLGDTAVRLTLAPGEVRGVSFPVRVDEVGVQTLTVTALGGTLSDAVQRTVRVVPDGQRVEAAQSGALSAGSAALDVDFPAQAVPGSEQLYLEVYPAFLSSVVNGMDSLLAEPYGCFEQTTSTTWPNVLVTRYMRDTDQLTPEIELKASALINTGYQRLLTFEHPGGGFSWFGTQDPAPYLSVTSFGLMEFVDMSQVHEVDPDMIDRTLQWLLSQQQADGSWQGDQTEFFSFHDNLVRNTAFTAWAIATAGHDGPELDRALSYLKSHYDDSPPDLYSLAMLANAFVFAAPRDAFTASLLADLDDRKTEEEGKAYWGSHDVQTSFYGYGNDSTVTTTALITHAMLQDGSYGPTAAAALDYLASERDAEGNFGSTQATIWTLRALLLATSRGTDGAVGTLEVSVDGDLFATLELTEDQADVMTTFDLSAHAAPGAHTVDLQFAGTGKVSTNLVAVHHVPWEREPVGGGPLSVHVQYDRDTLALNDMVGATVTIQNETALSQRMVLVDLGVPPGFSVVTEDLDRYRSEKRLSKYEVAGRHLTLYLSELAGEARESFDYRLRADMPVRASDGGSRVYPYYEPDKVSSAPAATLEVTEGS